MGKTYLFSPVGNTDPIKYFRDGSMLHICRFYKPDDVYLYMSKEILEFHRKDNRFVRSIELLGELLQHEFHVHLIEKEDLVNVQDYDFFYREFVKEIDKIRKKMNPEDRLILNMASGTPAMKSALNVITTVAEFKFKAIQVASPKGKGNLEYDERMNYDVEETWKSNEDNQEEIENRCKEIECQNLILMLKKDIIKKHVLAYDYFAALSVANEIKEYLTPEAYTILQMAVQRFCLNNSEITKLQKQYGYDIYPVKEGDKRKIFEYALVLQIKIAKGELVDFVRGITPISIDLLYILLKKFCGIEIDDYTFEDRGIKKWDQNKLKGTEILKILDSSYKKKFTFGNVYSTHIGYIIQALCKDIKLSDNVLKLIKVEGRCRNMAAHEIVSVTDEWILRRVHMNAGEIMDIIRYLCGMAGVVRNKEHWKSYDKFNEDIIKLVEQ